MTSLLCETVTGRSMAELRAARDSARDADMVELRLDGVADVDVAGALEGRRLPVIVTCRPRWEGGVFDGSEEERKRMLAQAIALGADYVDVEWKAGFDDLLRSGGGTRIVLSHHDFEELPADVLERCRAMRAAGASFFKIAFAASRLSDSLRVLDITRDGAAIGIAMGPAGVTTRILATRFGSAWTYAGKSVAPGQIPPQDMVETYRFRGLDLDTAVYGVVGNPIMHSLSPAMHNAAFAAHGMNAVYLPLQAAEFTDFLEFGDRIGVAGASVTIPFKVDALRHAAHVEGDAQAVGAVNTLRRHGAQWDATNTDVAGFLAPLVDQAVPLQDARVAVLGAGGAARAVVNGLASKGARVSVHARRPEQARAVAVVAGAATGSWPPAPGSWDVLVNCTPLGNAVSASESPLPGGPFGGGVVYDLVYVPEETRLLREARQAGCATIGGLPMLVAQAERQFEWWTGMTPPAGVMADAARRALSTRLCD